MKIRFSIMLETKFAGKVHNQIRSAYISSCLYEAHIWICLNDPLLYREVSL